MGGGGQSAYESWPSFPTTPLNPSSHDVPQELIFAELKALQSQVSELKVMVLSLRAHL